MRIVLEGPNKIGKSTIIAKMQELASKSGKQTIVVSEPDSETLQLLRKTEKSLEMTKNVSEQEKAMILARILDEPRHKNRCLAAKNPSSLLLWDRSFLSTLAFQFPFLTSQKEMTEFITQRFQIGNTEYQNTIHLLAMCIPNKPIVKIDQNKIQQWLWEKNRYSSLYKNLKNNYYINDFIKHIIFIQPNTKNLDQCARIILSRAEQC